MRCVPLLLVVMVGLAVAQCALGASTGLVNEPALLSALTAAPAAAATPAPAAEPSPAPAAAGTVTGVLQALGENRLVLSVGNELKTVNLQATTTILRNNQPATLMDLRLGDQVEAQTDAHGNTTSVKATYETLTGKVVAKTDNQITLDTRATALSVDPATEVTAADGVTPAMYSDIANGDTVTVRLTPGTNQVYGITLSAAVAPAAPATTTPENPAPPPPTAPATTPPLATPPEPALPAPGEGLAPSVVIYGLSDGEMTYNRLPYLAVEFTDIGGAGLDWPRCTVSLTGPDGPLAVSTRRVGRQLTLRFAPLPLGTITLTADGWDQAGRHTRQQLSFTIPGESAPLGELYISHNAVGRALMSGDMLRVTVAGPIDGEASFYLGVGRQYGPGLRLRVFGALGAAFFSLGGHWRPDLYTLEVPMAPVPGLLGMYRGSLLVPELEADQTLTLTVVAIGGVGRVWRGRAATPVHLLRFRPLLPRLVSPLPGAHLGNQTTIEGYTEPYATVTCTLQAQAPGAAGPSWTTQLTLYADGQGHFLSAPVQLGGPADGPVTYSLSAVANQETRKSPAATVTFAR